MNDLIMVTDGVALLDAETASQIAEFERKLKEIKEAEDVLRAALLEEMYRKGIKSVSTDEISITFKASYDKESFKGKEFRADHPDLYDEYVKMSPVKASVTIKLKEETA